MTIYILNGSSQVLPVERQFDWEKAGIDGEFKTGGLAFNVLESGARNDGSIPVEDILQAIIDENQDRLITLYFPAGTYRFTSSVKLKDSVIIKGEGAEETILNFDLDGSGHLFEAVGQASFLSNVIGPALKGSNTISTATVGDLLPGDLIRIYQNDDHLVISDWARQSTGQIVEVLQVDEGVIVLKDKLRMTYSIENSPKIEKIKAISNVGINCVRMVRQDQSINQTSNIRFRYARNCWVQGIVSEYCNFSHLELAYSTNILVSGSYFTNAFDFGGGGKAYGVVAHFSTGNCLIQNNIFEKLRHSMLVQAGASGNVFGYNYSINPYWDEIFSPSNAAGDIVLHGNYPYANLFEGNIVQNIVIDNSHDVNGPDNTFFRNRAELYGIIMFPSPASDRQNFIGNDVSNAQADLGFFITFGNEHYLFGNLIKNEIIPENTSMLEDSSYYLRTKPAFHGHFPWPAIGTPLASSFYPNPALHRYQRGNLSLCDNEMPLITGANAPDKNEAITYPNPTSGRINWTKEKAISGPVTLMVRNMNGQTVFKTTTDRSTYSFDLSDQPPGFYLLITLKKEQIVSKDKMIIMH